LADAYAYACKWLLNTVLNLSLTCRCYEL